MRNARIGSRARALLPRPVTGIRTTMRQARMRTYCQSRTPAFTPSCALWKSPSATPTTTAAHSSLSGRESRLEQRSVLQRALLHDREEDRHQYQDVNRRGDHAADDWRRDWLHHVGADAALP